MSGSCLYCGEARRLTSEGVCAWRFGCEHRVRVREARAAWVLARVREIVDSFTPPPPTCERLHVPWWIAVFLREIAAAPRGAVQIWAEDPETIENDPTQHVWLHWHDQNGPRKAYFDGAIWSLGDSGLW